MVEMFTHSRRNFTILALAITTTCNARPEQYVALYGGPGFSQGSTIEGDATDYQYTGIIFIGPVYSEGNSYSVDYDYDSTAGPVVGARYGLWFSGAWQGWGIAGDLTYFSIDLEPYGGNIDILSPLSIQLFYRIPFMKSDAFTDGRFYLYGGPGLSLVLAEISIPGLPAVDDAGGIGLTLHGGCSWRINERLGLFTEYRFFYSYITGYNDDEYGTQVNATEIDLTAKVYAHHLLGGITVSF